MKKIIPIALVLLPVIYSCKKSTFLDDKTSSAITETAVFSDSAKTMQFLTRMYEEIGFNFIKTRWEGSGTTDQGTYDSEYTLNSAARRSAALSLGTYSAANFIFSDAWVLPWVDIRRANLLMAHLPGTPLSPTLQKRVMGEAKFMRAYFYTYLVINFGGVPLIGDKVFESEDIINLPRNTFEECVTYLSKELDDAAVLLPTPTGYDNIDYGRVTKGACQALKTRLLLFAASPLFNGGQIPAATAENKPLAGYPGFNVARWQAAADAANVVIQSGTYALYVDNTTAPGYGFYKTFLMRTVNGGYHPEMILLVNRPANREWETHGNPPSRSGGKNLQPTQNLVDAFPMKNGKAITDPTSGYDPANPYKNRDPRFDNTIIYNGSLYYSTTVSRRDTVFTYENKSNSGGTADGWPATFTGYYSRKMCDADISANSAFNTERGWGLIRYAEVLLAYAEAINETGQTALAYPKLIELRRRAGIDAGADGLYGMKAGMSQAEMRDFVRNERHIELCFEGDQTWDDIRRWKTAEVINNSNNGLVTTMHITRNPTTPGGSTYAFPRTYTYTREPTTRPIVRLFYPAMYLFPIPQDEINKQPAMIQNPGW